MNQNFSVDEDNTRDMPKRAEPSPFDRAYRGLLRGLYEGSFIPGQRLAAPDLMNRFGVGRGTIREVLHRLVASGVVSIIPNRGATVRHLTRTEVYSVLDVVEVLLGLAARGAALHLRCDEERELFGELHRKLHPTTGNYSAFDFFRAREAYYRFLFRIAGNHELQRVFPDAQVHIMRVQLRTFGQAADSAAPEDFTELTDAILTGDPEAAEVAGRRHVGYTRMRVAHLPDRAFSREP